MKYMIEFDFKNGIPMQMKMMTGTETEVKQWASDNGVTDAKILKVMEVKVR